MFKSRTWGYFLYFISFFFYEQCCNCLFILVLHHDAILDTHLCWQLLLCFDDVFRLLKATQLITQCIRDTLCSVVLNKQEPKSLKQYIFPRMRKSSLSSYVIPVKRYFVFIKCYSTYRYNFLEMSILFLIGYLCSLMIAKLLDTIGAFYKKVVL